MDRIEFEYFILEFKNKAIGEYLNIFEHKENL